MHSCHPWLGTTTMITTSGPPLTEADRHTAVTQHYGALLLWLMIIVLLLITNPPWKCFLNLVNGSIVAIRKTNIRPFVQYFDIWGVAQKAWIYTHAHVSHIEIQIKLDVKCESEVFAFFQTIILEFVFHISLAIPWRSPYTMVVIKFIRKWTAVMYHKSLLRAEKGLGWIKDHFKIG